MATKAFTDEVETAARALLDERVAAVRSLAHTRQVCLDKRTDLDEAERADAIAYAAAERAGWTADELRKVGLDAPTRKAPGRPRRAAGSTSPATVNGSSPDNPGPRADAT